MTEKEQAVVAIARRLAKQGLPIWDRTLSELFQAVAEMDHRDRYDVEWRGLETWLIDLERPGSDRRLVAKFTHGNDGYAILVKTLLNKAMT